MKRYSIYLFLQIFIIFLLYHTVGIYAEELAEMANAAAHNALFVDKPIRLFNNSNNFTIITYLIAALKETFPNYNVHGLMMLFMSCVFLTNYFMIVHQICTSNNFLNSKKYIEIIFYVFIYALLFDTIIFTQYTRVSFHLLTSGFILYHLTASKWLKSIAIISVIVGLMIRFDTFFVVAPLCLLYYLFLVIPSFSFSILWNIFKKNIHFILLIFFFVLFSDINFTKADKVYEPYRSVIYSFECYQAKGSDFKLKNALDSLKYKMVENHFYNEISIEEMYAIGIKPTDRDPFNTFKNFNNFRIQKGWNDFKLFFKYNYRYILIYFVCMLLLISFVNFKKSIRIISLFLFSILLLLLISIYIKLEDRVAFPILNVSLLLIFFYSIFFINGTGKMIYPVSLLVIILLFNKHIVTEKIRDRRTLEQQINNANSYLSSHSSIKVVYWDFVLFYLFLNKEASPSRLYNRQRDFMIDNSLFYITDEYRNHMLKNFNTYKFIEVIKQTVNHPEKVFFTTPEKMEFYLKTLTLKYNMNVKAEKVDNEFLSLFPKSDSTFKFYLYKLID